MTDAEREQEVFDSVRLSMEHLRACEERMNEAALGLRAAEEYYHEKNAAYQAEKVKMEAARLNHMTLAINGLYRLRALEPPLSEQQLRVLDKEKMQ